MELTRGEGERGGREERGREGGKRGERKGREERERRRKVKGKRENSIRYYMHRSHVDHM